jgi:uncharacterized protein YcfJ
MKKLLATAAVLSSLATTAIAETVRARITSVEPRYHTVYQNAPTMQCQNVEVPIYGTVQGGGASGGDVLAGMIIGGLLGKGVTGDDGGAAAGAVVGGIIAAEEGNNSRRVVTGYRTERQCSEVMVREEVRELKDYVIRFEWNGIEGSAYTYNRYRVGDRINATVNIRAN